MAAISRPLLALVVALLLGVAMWLAVPRPGPVAVRHTPLAPTQQIQKAQDASALSDATNARLQAAAEQAGR
jgi:hypothetical protein